MMHAYKKSIATFLSVLCLLGTSLGSTSAQAREPTLHASKQVNLQYRLDCQAAVIRCGDSAFAKQLTTANPNEDARMLLAWHDFRSAAYVQPAARMQADTTPYPSWQRLYEVNSRYRNGVRAQPSAAQRALSQRDIERHFAKAHEAHWQSNDQGHLQRIKVGLTLLWSEFEFDTLNGQIEKLLWVQKPPAHNVQLIAIPSNGSGSIATIGDGEIFVETALNEKPSHRLGVLMHEIVHVLLAHSSDKFQTMWLDAIAANDLPQAAALYSLFNEAIATAIGNGHAERLLQTKSQFERYHALPESFYADVNIDRIAKAILPMVSAYLNDAREIDAQFIEQYLQLACAALAEDCDGLALQLRNSAFVLGHPDYDALQRLGQQQLGVATAWTEIFDTDESEAMTLLTYPMLSGVFIADYENDQAIAVFKNASLAEQIDDLKKVHSRFVFGWPRSRQSTIYFVLGEDVTQTALTFLQFANKAQRFEGLWLPPIIDGKSIP